MGEDTYRPFQAFGAAQWTKLGELERWNELAQTAVDPAEPENVLTRGLKNTASAQTQNLSCGLMRQFWPGEKLIGFTAHLFATTTATEKTFSFTVTLPLLTAKTVKPTATGKKWWSWGTSGANGALFTQAELETIVNAGGNEIIFSVVSEKAASQTVFEVYFTAVTEGGPKLKPVTFQAVQRAAVI